MVVLLLLVANIAFGAWSNGWLSPWGWAPATESEPQRLGQQVAPEKLQLQIDPAPVEAATTQPKDPRP
ncbi:MAG: hypothetical protein EBQ82_03290 [Betaproteobacteria bacterium]|nr:hypothetical protein [Betaproteobacteria bacterium]